MKKEIIFVMAMSLVSSVAFAANDSASDANTKASNPKGSFDSTPPATGDKGYGAYNGSTGEKAPKAGAGVSGSNSGYGSSSSTSSQRDPAASASSSGGAYEGTASSSGADASSGASATTTASAGGSMETFNKLDKNKDGMLSKAEARKDKTVSKNFSKIDTDKDGKISQSEYQAYIGGAAGAGTSGGSSSAAPGLQTDPSAGSANRGATDTGAGTSGGAKDPSGNNIR